MMLSLREYWFEIHPEIAPENADLLSDAFTDYFFAVFGYLDEHDAPTAMSIQGEDVFLREDIEEAYSAFLAMST